MIKGWKRPDLEPGPLKSLNDALHDLHARSGYRSSREIEKWIRADQGTGGISHTTVHKMFTNRELPRPELMHWVGKFFSTTVAFLIPTTLSMNSMRCGMRRSTCSSRNSVCFARESGSVKKKNWRVPKPWNSRASSFLHLRGRRFG